MIAFKQCCACLEMKAGEEFNRDHSRKDGLQRKCRECSKKYDLARKWANIEAVRAYQREQAKRPHRVAQSIKSSKTYYAKFPERGRAKRAVYYALSTGKLVPLPCFICGSKAVAHHPDYDRPLDVVWLCQAHHKQAHALVKQDHHGYRNQNIC